MLIVRFWIKIPKPNEESRTHEAFHFLDLENGDDPQIKELLEDWCADFPIWYNKANYLKFGYDVISKKEINDDIREMIKKKIIAVEKMINDSVKQINELRELI